MSSPAAFIQSLRQLGQRDLGKVAILRRSLSYEPGTDPRAYPMVEEHLPTEYPWDRTAYYLVASLWAMVNTASVIAAATREDGEDDPESSGTAPNETAVVDLTERGRPERTSLGYAIAQLYLNRQRPDSTEQRFVALLDADDNRLTYHLRQMVQLLRAEEGIRIYWVELLKDLRDWNRDDRRIQQRWARAFYQAVAAADRRDEENDTNNAAEGA